MRKPPIKIEKEYFGMTYPNILGKGLFGYLWKRFMCKRNMHLFDEYLSSESHCLCCDICQLYVEIKYIDVSYLEVNISDLKRLEALESEN